MQVLKGSCHIYIYTWFIFNEQLTYKLKQKGISIFANKSHLFHDKNATIINHNLTNASCMILSIIGLRCFDTGNLKCFCLFLSLLNQLYTLSVLNPSCLERFLSVSCVGYAEFAKLSFRTEFSLARNLLRNLLDCMYGLDCISPKIQKYIYIYSVSFFWRH